MDQTVEQTRLIQTDPPGYQEAWEMVVSQLAYEMKRAEYESWVQPLKPLGYKEGVFRVGAVNVYARDWVDTRLRSRIKGLLEGILNQPLSLSITLVNSKAELTAAERLSLPQETKLVDAPSAVETPAVNGKRKKGQTAYEASDVSSPRKIQLQRAYGSERASVIQPERGMFVTMYLFNNWLPLLGHSAFTAIMAARSLCYWNPMTGELRNVVETDMGELARRASVSVRTIKDVLNNELVKQYFLRYKVRRVMTPNGVRTAGIILQVRMDDPLTPEDQASREIAEEHRWYTADFDDEAD